MKNTTQIIIAFLIGMVCVAKCEAQGILEENILYRNESFIVFSSSLNSGVEELFLSKEVLGSDDNDEFILESFSNNDSLGVEISVYRQYRWGFQTNSIVKLRTENGKLRSATGRLDKSTSFPTAPLTDVSQIFEMLKDSLGIMEYVWESYNLQDAQIINPKIDTFIVTEVIENGDTVWLDYADDEGYFVVLDDTVGFWVAGGQFPTVDTVLENGQLYYSFVVQSRLPHTTYNVVVNAIDGYIVSQHEDKFTANGSGATRYNGVRNFNTAWYGPYWIFWERYNLFDHSRGDGIHTKFHAYNNTDPSEALDGNNLWYEPEHASAISAHWAVQEAWDYFLTAFGRPGFDGNGREVNVVTDLLATQSNPACNAFFRHNSEKLEFVRGGSGCNPSVSLDIVSHEYVHGILKYGYFSNPNAYYGESGALNESFADIFGTTVEYYVGNSNDPWQIGDDIPNPIQVRDLSNPNNTINPLSPTLGQPSWYGQPNYWLNQTECSPDDDNNLCGVHINSGVQNHWFYLLTEGGSSPQPGNSTQVQGIGREKAALITYRNMNNHLTSFATYADARIGSILAAVNSFGACSFEVEQTINAWDAVNVVGDGNTLQYDLNVDCSDLSSTHFYALQDLSVSCDFTNESSYKMLTAGRTLSLEPGFNSNSHMHLKIEPCLVGSGKREEIPSYEGFGGDLQIQAHNNDYGNPEPILFPNPSDGRFAVRAIDAKMVLLFDMTGRLITQMRKVNETTYFTSDVPSGSYIVSVILTDGKTHALKAIVK